MGLQYGENFTILTSTVFYDSRRDGRTDGRAIAYMRCNIKLSRVKTIQNKTP